MKILILVLSIISVQAWAANRIPVSGSGTSSDWCEGSFGMSCIQSAGRQAERQAQMDMDQSCRMRRGMLTGSFCSHSCSPRFLSSDAPRTWIHCSARCTASCNVP